MHSISKKETVFKMEFKALIQMTIITKALYQFIDNKLSKNAKTTTNFITKCLQPYMRMNMIDRLQQHNK